MRHIDELELLAYQLGKDINKNIKFYMGVWKRDDSCNTVACAIGYHCTVNTTGLKLKKTGDKYHPFYKNSSSFSAISEYFEISLSDAVWLFDPESYNYSYFNITPKIVSSRIYEFIAFYNHHNNLQ